MISSQINFFPPGSDVKIIEGKISAHIAILFEDAVKLKTLLGRSVSEESLNQEVK